MSYETHPPRSQLVIERVKSMTDITSEQKKNLIDSLELREKLLPINENDFLIEQEPIPTSGWSFLARHKTLGIPFVKQLNDPQLKPCEQKKLLEELHILYEIATPYYINFYGLYTNDSQINMLIEHMDLGDLDTLLLKVNRIPEEFVSKLFESVIKCLVYLTETHGVLHTNLEPSNVMINSRGEVKLSQLKKIRDDVMSGQTKVYHSPEQLQQKDITEKSLVWTCGIMAFESSIGEYPLPPLDDDEIVQVFSKLVFPRDERKKRSCFIFDLIEEIVDNKIQFKLPSSCFSEEFIDFINSCLNHDESKRPSLRDLLEHGFIQKHQNNSMDDFVKWINQVNSV